MLLFFHGFGFAISLVTLAIKLTIHASGEIDAFVETHRCKLCVVLLSRVSLGVCHKGYRSTTPLRTTVQLVGGSTGSLDSGWRDCVRCKEP